MNSYKPSPILFTSCLAFTIIIGLFSPIDMLMNNTKSVWFGLGTILLPILIVSIILFGFLFLLGCFFKPKGQICYSYILIGLAIASYIQGNFLNRGLNVLNGTILTDSINSIVFNIILWFAILVVSICFSLFVKSSEKIGFLLSLILILTLSTTLLIESIGTPFNNKTNIVTTDDIYEIGNKENIIVLLVDMLDQEYMDYYLTNHPNAFNEYEGFTYYNNYMGLFASTRNSVGHMLSGIPFHNETSIKEYREKSFSSDNLYLSKLVDSGYECDIYTHVSYMEHCNPILISNYQTNVALKAESITDLISTWYKTTLYRYVPIILRNHLKLTADDYDLLERSYGTNNHNVYTETQAMELEFYHTLQKNKLSVVNGSRYKFIHLWGMHVPFGIDADCNSKSDATWNETLEGCFKIVSCYLDALKEANAYDNSTIILLSDHGAYNYSATNPFLMVKPAKARTPFTVSKAPVWQKDYVPSILKAANIPYESYGQAFDDILPNSSRERLYYMYFQEDQPLYGLESLEQIEFITNDISSNLFSFTPTGFVYGNNGTRELAKYTSVSSGVRLLLNKIDDRELFDYGICSIADSDAFSWGYNSQISCTLQDYKNQDVTMLLEMQSVIDQQSIKIKAGEKILYEGPVMETLSVNIPSVCIDDSKLILKIEYPDAKRACLSIDPRNLFTVSVLYNNICFQY